MPSVNKIEFFFANRQRRFNIFASFSEEERKNFGKNSNEKEKYIQFVSFPLIYQT